MEQLACALSTLDRPAAMTLAAGGLLFRSNGRGKTLIQLASLSSLFLCLTAGAAIAAAAPPTPTEVALFKEKGAYVFRASGESLPLYTFDRDQAGKSNCNGPCVTAWPPLVAASDSATVGDWSVVKRDDGVSQWAWRGKPIYTFAKDSPEKATGDGAGGVWHLIPSIPAN